MKFCDLNSTGIDDCKINTCDYDRCTCSSFIFLKCKSYELNWSGVHLTAYAKPSKMENLFISDYGFVYNYNGKTRSNSAGLEIDYFNQHLVNNLTLETYLYTSYKTGVLVHNLNPFELKNF